jgi:hypothetical protein
VRRVSLLRLIAVFTWTGLSSPGPSFYTLARTAIHDGVTVALAVATDRVPPVLAVLAAGGIGWLLSR